MDASSTSDINYLPYLVWRNRCDGLAQHAIRQSESVSDDASGLSDGMSGCDCPVPSGNGYRYFGAWSLCSQANCVVLFLRAAVACICRPCETTRISFPLGLTRVGDSDVALGGNVEVKVKVEGLAP